jgi:predicted outer membrane protein
MKALLPLSIACVLALAACDRDRTDDAATADANTPAADAATPQTEPGAAPTADMPSDAADPAADPAAANADGEALGLLAAINEHEIAAARQAKEKQVDGDVLEFAELMETEHGTNQEKTQALGPAQDGPDIAAQKQKGKAELDALAAKSGDEYEKAYIDAMVKGHQEALTAIDEKMIPRATRDDVKQHLTETRRHVEMHLTRAKEIAGKQ